MKPAVKWSIVAVSFLVMFVLARVVVQDQMNQEPEISKMARSSRPPHREPPAPEPMVAPDLAVLDLQADATPEARAAAHDALDTWAWLAEGEVRAALGPQLAEAQANLEQRGLRDLASHALWARWNLSKQGETPDPALDAELTRRMAAEPDSFSWKPPETGTASECGADCG